MNDLIKQRKIECNLELMLIQLSERVRSVASESNPEQKVYQEIAAIKMAVLELFERKDL